MGSLLEKITLYDLLGYTLPGCVLLLLVLFGADKVCIFAFLCKWDKYIGILYVAFFLVSYLSGIVLSELTDVVMSIFMKVKAALAPVDCENNDLLRRQVVRALKKSGYYEETELVAETIDSFDIGKYMGYMYASVQVRSEYKRIHDYASAYVLYKNLTAAFAIGTVVLFVSKSWNFGILILGIILTVLMIKRSIRFYHKKNKYAVVWFLDRYLCNDQNVS